MRRTIWKYAVKERTSVQMPKGAQILTVQMQRCVPGHPRMKFEEVDGHLVSVWDDGPKVNDRYSVVLLEPYAPPNDDTVCMYGMNEVPFSPNCGVAMSQDIKLSMVAYKGRGGAFGKRIKFSELPEDCQKAARQWLKWD